MDSYNLTHTGAELDSAVGRALEGFAAADAATEAAKAAAKLAEDTAAEVQEKLDNGEFIGPVGSSGVYVGSGEMPEGYTVQVDPTGDMLCYTAGESDDRYANVLTGTASGPVAALEDVSPTGALRRAAVLGATAETWSGDKGPDNPYTLAGVQPTKVTVCGRNLIPYPYASLPSTVTGISFADNGDGTITVNGTAADETAGRLHFLSNLLRIPAGTYTLSGCAPNGSGDTWCLQVVRVINGLEDWGWLCRDFGAGITFTLTEATDIYIRIRLKKGTVINNGIFKPQLEIGTAATPYEPYSGQTVPVPTLEPLYGDGTVNDEYDAVTGVETRRWKQMTLDGTETISVYPQGNRQYQIRNPLSGIAYTGISSHYVKTVYPVAWDKIPNGGCQSGTWAFVIHDDACDTLDEFKAYLAARATAGTPVTVLYQLDEPVITQHDPARILPPAPVCRVFADAGGVDVGYNRDINIAFEQQQAEYIAQIKALDARIAKLETGQPAEPMT